MKSRIINTLNMMSQAMHRLISSIKRLWDKSWEIEDIEITFREIMFSIIIFCVMLFFGGMIGNKIQDARLDRIQKYSQAIQIDNQNLFEYGMSTNVGNALCYGEMTAIDPVSDPDVDGEYLTLTKTYEHYTMHTRIVEETHTDSEGHSYTTSHVETYYSWDEVRSWHWSAAEVTFLGKEFPLSKFSLSYGESGLPTKYITSDDRFCFSGRPVTTKGTIFTYLSKDGLADKTSYYVNETPEDVIKDISSNVGYVIFWIFWIIGTVILIILFYVAENKWLED